MSANKDTTRQKKKAMLSALEKTLGIVTEACKKSGVSRATHYRWMEEDEQYKKDVHSIDDVVLDFAESQLHTNIKKGSDTATIFFLKTKGKKRGYIEKQQIEHSGGINTFDGIVIDGE